MKNKTNKIPENLFLPAYLDSVAEAFRDFVNVYRFDMEDSFIESMNDDILTMWTEIDIYLQIFEEDTKDDDDMKAIRGRFDKIAGIWDHNTFYSRHDFLSEVMAGIMREIYSEFRRFYQGKPCLGFAEVMTMRYEAITRAMESDMNNFAKFQWEWL